MPSASPTKPPSATPSPRPIPKQARLQPLAWANADTGSRGAISSMIEKQEDGPLCRKFTASRESFDGVALYAGDACKGDRGIWYMRTFKPL